MKRILIIGATSAIASARARLWAANGAQLFVVGRDAAKLDALAEDLAIRGASSVQQFRMDGMDVSSHQAMLEAASACLERVDIVLIAYGTLPDQSACQREVALAVHEFSTNATSVIALLTVIANFMESQRSGSISVITSVAGERGRASNYVYGSAKAALSVYCEGLRARLFKSGVSVTDIRPGFVATPMTSGLPLPPLLVAQPDMVARRIVAGIARRAEVLYAPSFWAPIMLIIRTIPRGVFKRMNI